MNNPAYQKILSLIVSISKYALVSLTAFGIFGLLLAIAWALPVSERMDYKLAASILVAGLSIIAGGYLMGKLMSDHKPIRQASEWGFCVGFVGFGYLFGVDWRWLVALLISGVLATLGGWISQKQT